jgi:hypothetical protein
MRRANKKVPIKAAKEIAKNFDKEQVVIVTFNQWSGYTVTTYGSDKEKCKQAAMAGDFVKKAIGGEWN